MVNGRTSNMAYLPKLNPTVGGGLGGLPERAAGGGGGGSSYAVGDIRNSVDPIDATWLPTDGSRLLQEDYSELYAKYGLSMEPVSGDINLLDTPNILPTNSAKESSWSSDGTYLAVAHQNSPYITIYKRSGDALTKLANPSSLPSNTCFSVDFSSDDTYLAVGSDNAPYILIYKRSGDTFTKLANPSSLPANSANTVDFSSDDTYLAVVLIMLLIY